MKGRSAMNPWKSVAAVIIATIVVAAGAFTMLTTLNKERPADPVSSSSPVSTSGTPISDNALGTRPQCSAAVPDLPCLGAEKSAEAKPVAVLNIWAAWCAPCREELPIIAGFAQRHPEYDVAGVHANPEAGQAIELLDQLGVELPSYQDAENTFAIKHGIPPVLPVTVVLKDGQVQAVYPQPFHSVAELEEAIAKAL